MKRRVINYSRTPEPRLAGLVRLEGKRLFPGWTPLVS